MEWSDKFFYNGISLIFDQPEFQDISRMRFLIKVIEDKESIIGIINRDFNENVKVYIGQELDCPGMESCALAVSRYSIKKKPLGRVAVLGPVRMQYNHIIPALEYVAQELNRLLE
jgi:heat-inducible transcriptional repressor